MGHGGLHGVSGVSDYLNAMKKSGICKQNTTDKNKICLKSNTKPKTSLLLPVLKLV